MTLAYNSYNFIQSINFMHSIIIDKLNYNIIDNSFFYYTQCSKSQTDSNNPKIYKLFLKTSVFFSSGQRVLTIILLIYHNIIVCDIV